MLWWFIFGTDLTIIMIVDLIFYAFGIMGLWTLSFLLVLKFYYYSLGYVGANRVILFFLLYGFQKYYYSYKTITIMIDTIIHLFGFNLSLTHSL